MRASRVVVIDIARQHMTQVPLPEHDDMVKALPVPPLLGRVVVKRFQNFSVDPALMSVAGSALLFGIGTLALP